VQSFSELQISTYIKERLTAANFVTPTPVQAAALPHAIEGKDVLASAQTGTGKTLAFLIPVIEQLMKEKAPGVMALVLVPTRELAMQVAAHYDLLRGRQLSPAAVIVGGLAEGPQLLALRRGARLVVATPGRLEDFLDRKSIDLRNVRILVLDEADRMLDVGFLPAIRRIAGILPKQRQTMCFSATLEGDVVRLVADYMKNPVRVEFGSTMKPAANVRLQAFEVIPEHKQAVLRRLLLKETGRCLVFVRTKRGADKLANALSHDGLNATMIHGNRSQSQRTKALAGFQQGHFKVLVATDVASRGIHVEEIVHVINYDLPGDAESFIHRVGRTGRVGKNGCASTLFTRSERADLQKLERTLGIRMESTPSGVTQTGSESRVRSQNAPRELGPRETSPRETSLREAGPRFQNNSEGREPAGRFQMIALHGEILQAQLEN
jgi:ATP-dependent RNA helicase RhlE